MDPTEPQFDRRGPGALGSPEAEKDRLGPPSDQDWRVARALLDAYRQGAFPMASLAPGSERDGVIRFYRPEPRAILPLDGLRVSSSLRQRMRSGRFILRSDAAIEEVIRACASPRPGPWLSDQLIELYLSLARTGHVHTVEAWVETPGGGEQLVGGLYGVTLGGLFAGESMFCRPRSGGTDASKVCLAALTGHLRQRGYLLHDIQMLTPHLQRMGGVEISGDEYLCRLASALDIEPDWGQFDAAAAVGEVAGSERQ